MLKGNQSNIINFKYIILAIMKYFHEFQKFYPLLGLALDNEGYFFEYRKGEKGRLYIRNRLTPTFENKDLELYRFKRGENIYVFVISKTGMKRKLAFNNWPFGKAIFVLLLDSAIMIADRNLQDGTIECRDIKIILLGEHSTGKISDILSLRTPCEKGIQSDKISYSGNVLTIDKYHYLPMVNDGKLDVERISEYQAREIRHRAAQKDHETGWVQVAYLEKYGKI